MKNKIKLEWLRALRSRKYKQGRHELRKTRPGGWKAYCCLGVLLHTQDPDNARLKYAGSLGLTLLKRFGMNQMQQNKLICMNDDQRLSFRKIANWIEKNL